MLGRFLFNRIGAVVIGVLAIGFGIYFLTSMKADCGGQQMSEGDTCKVTTNGTTELRTYAQQQSSNTTTGYVTLGVGIVALVGGVIANIRHAKKKAAATTGPVATA